MKQRGVVCAGKLSVVLNTSILLATILLGIGHATAGGMATPVGFNVNETGAANFNIPIEIPPGTAGIAPSLSLNYTSQGGNGMLGMGWSLGGLSAIYRCGRTLIQDGVKDTVNYNTNDRYCLDGQRLVAVSGAYGANGTEYRTERESFTKVISYGTAGSGPAWFKAWTKAGQIIEFGNTTDSAIEAQGKTDIRAWSVNKISDTKGNYLTVSYTEDNANGDYRPNRIDYTGNAGAALTPYNSVRFVYQSRTDITPMYQAGAVIKTMMRLANVQTYAKVGATDTLVRDYRLVYDISTATQRSRLISLTECVGDGTCLPATTVGWQGGIASIFPTAYQWSSAGGAGVGYVAQLGDFNGDGKADIYLFRSSDGQNTVWLNNGDGTFPTSYKWSSPGGYGTGYVAQLGDFNGDGKTDIYLFRSSDGTHAVWLNQGDGTFANTYQWTSPGGGYGNGYTAQLGDFNGDGKTDIYLFRSSDGTHAVWLNQGDGTFANTYQWTSPGGGYGNGYTAQLGDFNGDGKVDIYLFRSSDGQNTVWVNNPPFPDLLSTTTTSLGATTSLAYKPITDSTIYTKDTNAAYPYLDLQAPLYVVSSASVPNGIGGTRSTSYKYSGAKAHLTGGGFLGFRQFDVTDGATLIKNSTVFRQDYPYQGLPSTVSVSLGSSTLKTVTNTWGFDTFTDTVVPIATANGSKHHFPKLTQSVESSWDLNGAALPVVTTANQYDIYGNATQVTVSTNDGYSKTTSNTYTNDLVNWYLGRLTRSTVTSTSP